MESEGNWNKLSATQAQILALAVTSNSNSRNNGSSNNQNRNNGNGGNGGKSKPMTDAFRQALQKAPTDGVTTKTFSDGKERHWCSKCSGGQGRWSFHKESDHTEKHDKAYAAFKERQAKANNSNATGGNNNSKGKKGKKGSNKDNKASNSPTLAIDKKYLEVLKGGSSSTASAFFSQFVPGQVKE